MSQTRARMSQTRVGVPEPPMSLGRERRISRPAIRIGATYIFYSTAVTNADCVLHSEQQVTVTTAIPRAEKGDELTFTVRALDGHEFTAFEGELDGFFRDTGQYVGSPWFLPAQLDPEACTPTSVSRWRRWVLLLELCRRCEPVSRVYRMYEPVSVQLLLRALTARGWAQLLPSGSPASAARRTLQALERHGQAKQLAGTPSRWAPTDAGHAFARNCLANNCQLTRARLATQLRRHAPRIAGRP